MSRFLQLGARFFDEIMRLLRSDSPEVAQRIASGGALACWGWSAMALASLASVLSLLIALVMSFVASVRSAVWVGVPVLFALNAYLLWHGKSPRLNWVVAGCADRVYIRLFAPRGRARRAFDEQDAIVLEASEIASMSIRTIEVFLYGPKRKILEWLVIEPAEAVAADVFGYIDPLLCGSEPTLSCIGPIDPNKLVLVGKREGALTIEWKWCRPASRLFLQKLARECPSVVIAREEHSELDLNGIWNGISLNLDAQKRHLLIQAKRLGFGSDCVWLLCRYKYISLRKAAAYMAEIEREEARADATELPQAMDEVKPLR